MLIVIIVFHLISCYNNVIPKILNRKDDDDDEKEDSCAVAFADAGAAADDGGRGYRRRGRHGADAGQPEGDGSVRRHDKRNRSRGNGVGQRLFAGMGRLVNRRGL